MPPTGFEDQSGPTGMLGQQTTCDKHNRPAIALPPQAPKIADPDLAAVVEAWPILPDAIRAGVMALVRSSAESSGKRPKPKRG